MNESSEDASLLDRLSEKLRDLLQRPRGKARIVNIEQLPPAADGRQYRYEVSMKLDDSVESAPTDDEMHEIADGVLDRVKDIDDPEWPGANEIYIQVYSPDMEVGAGACGTAHWTALGGTESIEVSTRDYMF